MSENRIQGGYILLSRKIIESEIWNKPPLYLKIWIYLLSRTQFKNFNGLERGQVFFSIPEIQEACSHYVGFRKEVPTYDQVRKAIDWMKQPSNPDNSRFSYEDQYEDQYESQAKTSMITTMKTTRGLVANIVNYNVYQDPKNYEDQYKAHNENQAKTNTKDERRPKGAHTIDKNDKNVKNVRMIDAEKFIKKWNENFKEKINQSNLNQSINQLSNYSSDEIFNVLDKATKSNYLLGLTEKNNRGLTFNFFTKPNNFEKINSGAYDTFESVKENKNKKETATATKAPLYQKDLRDDEKARQDFIEMKLKQKIPIKIKNKEK